MVTVHFNNFFLALRIFQGAQGLFFNSEKIDNKVPKKISHVILRDDVILEQSLDVVLSLPYKLTTSDIFLKIK